MTSVLNQESGDAIELRRHEARATGEGLQFKAMHVGGIEHGVPRIRVGIERHIRHIAATEMRREEKDCVGRSGVFLYQHLPGLAGLHACGQRLVERYRRKDANAPTAADWKDAAAYRVKLERIAERLQIIPAPDALGRDVDGKGDAWQHKGLRPRQGRAAACGYGRVGGGIIDTQREGERGRWEKFEAIIGAKIA